MERPKGSQNRATTAQREGIVSGRSPCGAPKEAKEAKQGMNQPRMKADASKGDQEPPESGVKSKGECRAREESCRVGGRVRAKRSSKQVKKRSPVVIPSNSSPQPHKYQTWWPKKGKTIDGNRLLSRGGELQPGCPAQAW